MLSPSADLRSVTGYLAGVILGSACLTLVFLGMRAVMDVGGACADGGPYVSAQPCPEGTAVAMIGGIFGLFAAGGLMAWFGGRLGAGYVALIGLGWPALFISLGYNFLEYGIDPAGPSTDPEWGFLIPGVMFWAMGGIPLAVGLAGWRAVRSGSAGRLATRMRGIGANSAMRIEFAPNSWGTPRPVTEPGPVAPPHGPESAPEPDVDEVLVSQLERLSSLHAAGALSDDEFAAAKARILSNERLDA
ncbi:MAG TPA: SHOCT domain-containing protein [Candidatus Limnocylindrales bacterium]|nr:SHOCT domain-containing protein [Candidatus Limnocylindrales bacterium]